MGTRRKNWTSQVGKGFNLPTRGSELKDREHGSTCVARTTYDVEDQQLTVEFMRRGTYTFFDFPVDEYANFNWAASRGTYFNLYIRDAGYEYERIA